MAMLAIVGVCCFFCLASVGAGAYFLVKRFAKTGADGSPRSAATTAESTRITVRDLRPDFALTSVAFGEEYRKNKKDAEAKYNGKIIELSGTIAGIGRNVSKEAHITLDGAKGELLGVMCHTTDPEPWLKYARGQKVRIRGRGPDFSFGAALIECEVMEAGPNPASVLTADQFAREYGADPEAAGKKYEKQHIILTGEIINKTVNDVGAISLELKGDGKTRVKCAFTAFERDMAEPLMVGDKIKVLGEYTLNFDKEEATLRFCFLMGKLK
jgi:putative nucleic acid binding protein